MKKQISIVIPCYNESEQILKRTILEVISSFKDKDDVDYEVIVVNDGSKKRFNYSKIQIENVRIINHKINRGYGAGLKTGILNAKYDLVGITDADGTYPNRDFYKLLMEMEDADMVIGARSWKSISAIRKVPKYILTQFASFLAGAEIKDLNSGFRIFKKDVSKQFWKLYPNGFSFTSTITMGCMTNKYLVKFMPIKYFKRDGKSHIKPIKDTIRFFNLVTRLALYFNPLRFFTPLSFFFLFLALLRGIRDIVVTDALGGVTLLLFFMGFQTFFMGLLAEIISKK